MLSRLIRFLRGTLTFTVRGPYPERFLNLCRMGGVGLWNSRLSAGTLTASTALSHRRQIEYYAEKSGSTLTIESRRGAKPVLLRYRRRKGLLIGAAVLALGFAVMSRMIWRIDIRGAETVSLPEVRTLLAENGVKLGGFSSRVPAREVARRLQVAFPEIAWCAVNLEGSTATVIIEETVPETPAVDDHVPTNVVAGRTGYITRMETHAGNAVVAPGDTVTEGQLLISGVMDNAKGESRTVHARGRIIAETREVLTAEVPCRSERFLCTAVAYRRYLRFGEVSLPLYFGNRPAPPYRLETVEQAPRGIFACLPVTLLTECYFLENPQEVRLTPAEARERAEEALLHLEEERLAGFHILSREVETKQNETGVTLRGVYLAEGEIGVSRPILTEEPAS